MTAQQVTCSSCQRLDAELERIKLQARMDLENLQTDGIILRRQVAKLKGELTKLRDDETPPSDVEELLLHWKARTGKNGRTDVSRGGKRYKLAQAALKRWGMDRCKAAIDGLAAFPFAGASGRTAESVPGSKLFNDVEHALSDEVRFERCEELAKVARLTPDERRTVAFLERQDQAKARKPSKPSWAQGSLRPWDPGVMPIDTVLAALEACGSTWKVAGRPNRWMAQCPAHDDRNPSLSIEEGDGISAPEGVVGLYCWAGCVTDDVVAALGLGFVDLFPARRAA